MKQGRATSFFSAKILQNSKKKMKEDAEENISQEFQQENISREFEQQEEMEEDFEEDLAEQIAVEALGGLKHQPFLQRVQNIPLVGRTVSSISHAYESTKNSNGVLRYSAESVESLSSMISKPVLSTLEPMLGTLDRFASNQLDKVMWNGRYVDLLQCDRHDLFSIIQKLIVLGREKLSLTPWWCSIASAIVYQSFSKQLWQSTRK